MSEQKSRLEWVIVLAVIAALATGAWWYLSGKGAGEKPTPPPVIEPQGTEEPQADMEAPAEEEPVEEPVLEPEPERAPPPPLDDSDKTVFADLTSLSSDGALAKWLVSDEVIRKWVAAVNTAAKGNLVHKHRPFKNIPGTIAVAEEGATGLTLSPDNYHRYDQPVRLFALVDTGTAVDLYRYWYPRLNQAYGELGIKGKSFHQQLLAAIDQVLAAPQVEEPIQLVRPSVYYKFADPKLEKLPGLHRLMIRMGPDNAERVKEKLRDLKTELEKIPVKPTE